MRSLKFLIYCTICGATLSFTIIVFYVKRVKCIEDVVILLKFAVAIKNDYE